MIARKRALLPHRPSDCPSSVCPSTSTGEKRGLKRDLEGKRERRGRGKRGGKEGEGNRESEEGNRKGNRGGQQVRETREGHSGGVLWLSLVSGVCMCFLWFPKSTQV